MKSDRQIITLGDACSRLSSGKGINSRNITATGSYPVYGGNGLRGYTNIPNFEGECAIIGRQGAFCGNVRYFQGTAYMTEHAVVAIATSSHNTRYLAYLLSTMNLGRLSGQSAQPGLSVKTLSKQVIELPSKEEQDKIAALLSALDDKIELNNRINENLAQQSQVLFDEFCTTTIWPISSLSKIATIKYGKGLPTKNLLQSGYPVFGGNGIIGYYSKYLYNDPQILISCRGAASGNIIISYPQSFVTNNSLVLELNDYRYFHFVKQYLLENPLYSYATGSAQPQITIDNIKDVAIPYPKLDEIAHLVDQLSAISNFCYHNLCEIDRLATIRDTILPKLMTGELDVSSLDI